MIPDTNIIIFAVCVLLIVYLLGLSSTNNVISRTYQYTTNTAEDMIIFVHKNIVAVLFLIAMGMIIF